jgi:endonuclease/exonuclease/phosphatase family metal-dependent hydrolase
MLHGFPRFEHLRDRLELIAAEIERIDPDVVCLQEVPWRPGHGTAAEYLASRSGLNYVYVRANGNRWAILFEEGEAILSRYPLRDVSFLELKPRAAFFEHRVALKATVEMPSADVDVVVTHLTHGDPQVNRGQVRALRGFVEQAEAGRTTIIAGDFNAVEDSSQIAGLGWIDTYRASNPDDPGQTCCVDDLVAGPGESLEMRIDYVFLSAVGDGSVEVDSRRAFVEPQAVQAGWLWASDHVGVLSVVSFEPAAEATEPGD